MDLTAGTVHSSYLYSLHLAECLALSRYLITVCWIKLFSRNVSSHLFLNVMHLVNKSEIHLGKLYENLTCFFLKCPILIPVIE